MRAVSTKFLSAGTATGYSQVVYPSMGQAFNIWAQGSTTAGSGAATIEVYGTCVNDITSTVTASDAQWRLLGTIPLTLGTTITNGQLPCEVPYYAVRVKITAISGTGASVDAFMAM